MNFDDHELTRPIRALFLMTVALLALAVASALVPPVDQSGRMQDFAYYMTFISKFWFEAPRDFYSFEVQQKVVSELFGFQSDTAMPLVWAPSTFVTFLPAATFYSVSPIFGALFWMWLSIGLLSKALWPYLKIHATESRGALGSLFVFCAILLSETTLRAILLSQTSLFALAVSLLLLTDRDDEEQRDLSGVGLFLLAIKPIYFIPAFILLVSKREIRGALIGTLLAVSACALVLAMMGQDAIINYAATVRMFASPEIPLHYRPAFPLDTLSTFGPVFSSTLGSGVSYPLSTFMLVIVLLVALNAGIRNELPKTAYALSLVGFLLFSPYLGSYEDLLFCSLLIAVLISGYHPGTKLVALFSMIVILNPAFDLPMIAVFMFKGALGLLGIVIIHGAERQQRDA